jgi:uncharacterized protein
LDPQARTRACSHTGPIITAYDVRGNLIPDALLAALAVEHGLTVYSTDTDFARFDEMRWENPLR